MKAPSSLLVALLFWSCGGNADCVAYCDAECGGTGCEDACEDAMSVPSDHCQRSLDDYLACVEENGNICGLDEQEEHPCLDAHSTAANVCTISDSYWYRF